MKGSRFPSSFRQQFMRRPGISVYHCSSRCISPRRLHCSSRRPWSVHPCSDRPLALLTSNYHLPTALFNFSTSLAGFNDDPAESESEAVPTDTGLTASRAQSSICRVDCSTLHWREPRNLVRIVEFFPNFRLSSLQLVDESGSVTGLVNLNDSLRDARTSELTP